MFVQYPQRKGCKQQDSNERATVNDTEAPGGGSDDSDDTCNDDGGGEDHDFDDSNDSQVMKMNVARRMIMIMLNNLKTLGNE